MPKESLVSVILLTLNSAKYIGRALSSVYAQSYKNLEVIVVDAGSFDTTKNIVHSFLGTRWLELPNSDMGMARNYGLKNSNGVFVMFLDSDDIYLEGKIKDQVLALNQNKKFDFVVSPAYVMRNLTGRVGIKDWTVNKLSIENFLAGQCYSLGTLCIKKTSLTKNCYFYEKEAGRYCEDWSFQLRLFLEGLCFEVLPKASVLVELRLDSHTDWSVQPKMKEVGLHVVKSAFSVIKENKIKHCTFEQDILDKYQFKLAISYFANGMLNQGRTTLSEISNDYKGYKFIITILSFIFPKFLLSYLLRNLWIKRQNSSFKWTVMPPDLKVWVDKHNKYLN